ncbi:MAG TPA: 5-oxoprolinase subunit PxpA [Acidimicrobiales bacterium]|nr:5-oxoprolinase subunit PxpA [Acidimicrobiales bacterium]
MGRGYDPLNRGGVFLNSSSPVIDLNSDMGEGFGAYRMGPDAELLGYVTSANIACGFHAGDPRTMDETVAGAVAAGVAIGAHVSYPDFAGFGRRHMRLSPHELMTDVLYQIGALDAFCRRHGTAVRYVKAHGALYNDMADDEQMAAAFAKALVAYGGQLAVLTMAGSASVGVFERAGIKAVPEAFADRAYSPAGRLVPRNEKGSVITDVALVSERGRSLALGHPVTDVNGEPLQIVAGSICVHSDTPGAVVLAAGLRAALAASGIQVRPFSAAT